MDRLRRSIAQLTLMTLLLSSIFRFVIGIPETAHAATITWDGGGSTNDWSEGANWSGDVAPGVADVATFNGTSTKNATIDASFAGSVLGVSVTSAYTGTITQARSLTVSTTGYTQAGGTFVGSADAITITGSLTLTGTTNFTSTSGTMTISRNFAPQQTGTFSHNNGTIVLAPDSSARTVNMTTSQTVYNLTVSATTDTNRITIATNTALIVANTLTLTNGEIGGTATGRVFRVNGTISHAATFDGGPGVLELNTALAFTPTSGGVMPGLMLTNAGSSFTGLGAATTTSFEGLVTTGPGIFNAGAGIIQFSQGLTVSTASTFNHNSGTIEFTSTANPSTLNVVTSETFNNVTINSVSATNSLSVAAGDTINVNGTLTLTNGELDTDLTTPGVVVSNGTLSLNAGFDGGTGTVRLVNADAIAPAAGATLPGFDFQHASSSFTGPGSGTVTIEGITEIGPGTFTAGAGTISFEEDVTINTSGTFVAGTGTIQFGGSTEPVMNVDSTETFNNLTVNMTASTAGLGVTSGDTLIVSGTLTLTNGQVEGNGIVRVDGPFSFASTFDGGEGNLEFVDSATVTMSSGQRLPGMRLTVSGSSITGVGAGLTNGIEGLVTLDAGTTFNAGAGTMTLGAGGPTGEVYGISAAATATFNHNSGTIVLGDDSDVTFDFSPTALTFFNMEFGINNTAPDTVSDMDIIFPDVGTTTFAGEVDFWGDISSFPIVRSLWHSETAGVQAEVDIQNATDRFGYIEFQDINNIGDFTECRIFCVDLGNNDGFLIGDPGILVSDVSGNTTESGGTATFTVELRNTPSSNVSVAIASGDTTEGTVSASSLTFTPSNWDTAQTVTVTGVNDVANDGAISYTVTVGPATSSDTYYSGREAADVTLLNEDNDTPTAAIDFQTNASFVHEDIADDLGITTFVHDYYGHGDLGGSLLGTRVRAGCKINLAGTEYVITRVWGDEVSVGPGYITITDVPASLPQDLEDTLGFASLAVNSITCTDLDGTGAILADYDYVATHDIDAGVVDNGMIYDAANNALWVDEVRVDLDTDTVIDLVGGTGSEPNVALDPTRDIAWITYNNSDNMVAFTASTGAYAFGNLAASTFAAGNGPEFITYDATNDKLWVVTSDDDVARQHNPATGALITSLALPTLSGSFNTRGVTYDSTNDTVWVVQNDGRSMIAIDGSTAAFKNGTVTNSTYELNPPDHDFQNSHPNVYDPTTNTLFVLNSLCEPESSGGDWFDEYVMKMDAATGEMIGAYPVTGCPTNIALNSADGTLVTSHYTSGMITEIRASDGTLVARSPAVDDGTAIAVDGEGDIWSGSSSYDFVTEYTKDGVPFDEYYTVTTTDTNQINVSTATAIDSTTVDETLNGQDLFYGVSFNDRASFKVFGSWRTIASSLASDHGGVDGNWYWRDNASTWTAATPNTANAAITAAIAAGANNQMTGSTLETLTNTDWALTGGFGPGTTTTLDVSVTAFTDDAHDAPVVRSIAFSLAADSGGGGGGGGPDVVVTNATVSIEGGATCTVDSIVTLTLGANGADDMLISNTEDFSGAIWEPFDTTKTWTLSSGDGTKTVYVKYRSADGNVSSAVNDSIILDAAAQCEGMTEPPPDDTETPPSTTPPPPEPDEGVTLPADVHVGDMIRTADSSTVYMVMANGTARPFPDLQTYLTYVDSCRAVDFVDDLTLEALPIGPAMMPNPGTVLVKFPLSPEVYVVELHPTDPAKVLLRWIASEAIAREMFGERWSAYVVEIASQENAYEIGSPITEPILADSSILRSRSSLNGRATYELYIVNPDGTRRFAHSSYARIERSSDGTFLHQFEDKGVDFDFNDVVLRVDPRSCLSFAFSVLPLEASWHHQIGTQIYYDGVLEKDVIISNDSHASVSVTAVVDITNLDGFTPFESLTQDEAEEQGFRASAVLHDVWDKVLNHLILQP